jgi:hypothetical protein
MVVTSSGVDRFSSSLSLLSFSTSPVSIILTVLTAVRKGEKRSGRVVRGKSQGEEKERRGKERKGYGKIGSVVHRE